MRFTRLIPALAVAALAVACTKDAPTALDSPLFSEHAGPIEFPVFNQFPGVNPCTGLEYLVTVTGRGWFQPHPNNAVVRIKSVINTSDGYEGRGNQVIMGTDFRPGDILKFSLNAMLTNPSDSRIRVHEIVILDFKDTPPSPPTARVDRFTAACVRS